MLEFEQLIKLKAYSLLRELHKLKDNPSLVLSVLKFAAEEEYPEWTMCSAIAINPDRHQSLIELFEVLAKDEKADTNTMIELLTTQNRIGRSIMHICCTHDFANRVLAILSRLYNRNKNSAPIIQRALTSNDIYGISVEASIRKHECDAYPAYERLLKITSLEIKETANTKKQTTTIDNRIMDSSTKSISLSEVNLNCANDAFELLKQLDQLTDNPSSVLSVLKFATEEKYPEATICFAIATYPECHQSLMKLFEVLANDERADTNTMIELLTTQNRIGRSVIHICCTYGFANSVLAILTTLYNRNKNSAPIIQRALTSQDIYEKSVIDSIRMDERDSDETNGSRAYHKLLEIVSQEIKETANTKKQTTTIDNSIISSSKKSISPSEVKVNCATDAFELLKQLHQLTDNSSSVLSVLKFASEEEHPEETICFAIAIYPECHQSLIELFEVLVNDETADTNTMIELLTTQNKINRSSVMHASCTYGFANSVLAILTTLYSRNKNSAPIIQRALTSHDRYNVSVKDSICKYERDAYSAYKRLLEITSSEVNLNCAKDAFINIINNPSVLHNSKVQKNFRHFILQLMSDGIEYWTYEATQKALDNKLTAWFSRNIDHTNYLASIKTMAKILDPEDPELHDLKLKLLTFMRDYVNSSNNNTASKKHKLFLELLYPEKPKVETRTTTVFSPASLDTDATL